MADTVLDPHNAGRLIPTVTKSNAIIKKHAKKAIETLEKMNAEDIIDILGLREYVDKQRN